MSFKYINPGYANLLDAVGGTTVENPQYSRTGVAFWQPASWKGIELPETPAEIYGKFDVYLKSGTNLDAAAFIGISGAAGAKVQGYRSSWTASGNQFNSTYFSSKNCIIPDAINTVWFHAKPGSSGESILRVVVNGQEIGNRTSINIDFRDTKTITIYSDSDNALISNLILSDEEISIKEQVIALPIRTAETDMADRQDGSYAATAEGQQILQGIDVSALADAYGEDSVVTGIALAGNPAYRTAEGLSTLTAISKIGDAVTEHGTHGLGTDVAGGVVDSHAVSMKLSELSAWQFGWKAGE